MSLENLKITQKQKKEIAKASLFNVKQTMKTETVGGEVKTITEILNPEQLMENSSRAEEMLMLAVYPEIKTTGALEELEVEEYDKKLQDILDYAEKNNKDWIIELELCQKHKEINQAKREKLGLKVKS
jgi:hypothetical protein